MFKVPGLFYGTEVNRNPNVIGTLNFCNNLLIIKLQQEYNRLCSSFAKHKLLLISHTASVCFSSLLGMKRDTIICKASFDSVRKFYLLIKIIIKTIYCITIALPLVIIRQKSLATHHTQNAEY